MNCRRCGYDLLGLQAAGRCPECGLDVIETLTHIVDPRASRLPRLRDPRGTGDGLVGLALCHFLMAAALLVPLLWPSLMSILDTRSDWGLLPGFIRRVDGHLLAATFALLGVGCVLRLAWAPADEPSAVARSFVRWMFAAQVGMVCCCLLPWWINWAGVTEVVPRLVAHTAIIPMAIVGLVGLRGVLGLVGLRSRAFRTAQGGRQSAKALVASLAAIMAAVVIIHAGAILDARSQPGAGLPEFVLNLGTSLFAGSSLLLLIGLGYMLVNTWWIRHSLRKPPPKLGELIGAGEIAAEDESTPRRPPTPTPMAP